MPSRKRVAAVDRLAVALDRAPVAQRIEHPPPKRGAASSILAGRANLRSGTPRELRWAGHAGHPSRVHSDGGRRSLCPASASSEPITRPAQRVHFRPGLLSSWPWPQASESHAWLVLAALIANEGTGPANG